MPVNPQRNLADALRRSQAAAADHILRFSQLSRADRELLVRRGFLFEIIKGWYALMTPQAQPGDTTLAPSLLVVCRCLFKVTLWGTLLRFSRAFPGPVDREHKHTKTAGCDDDARWNVLIEYP